MKVGMDKPYKHNKEISFKIATAVYFNFKASLCLILMNLTRIKIIVWCFFNRKTINRCNSRRRYVTIDQLTELDSTYYALSFLMDIYKT